MSCGSAMNTRWCGLASLGCGEGQLRYSPKPWGAKSERGGITYPMLPGVPVAVGNLGLKHPALPPQENNDPYHEESVREAE